MANFITVTKSGGEYGGSEKDTQIYINADYIISISNNLDDELIGKSKIKMSDKSVIYAKETAEEIVGKIN